MSNEEEGGSNPQMLTPADILRTARDYWALALILAVPVGYLIYHVRQQEEPIYRTSSVVLFEVKQENVIPINDVVDPTLAGIGGTQLGMENYLVHLRSRSFVQEVIDSLSADERKRIVDPYVTVENPNPSIAGIILSNFSVRILEQGTTVQIGCSHRDPEMAAFITNRITDRFGIFVTRRAARANESAMKFLFTEADDLRQQVKESQLVLQQYREAKNVVSLEENQNLVDARLSNVGGVVGNAQLELIQAESAWRESVEALEEGVPPIKLPAVMGYPGVRGAIEEVNRLEGQQELLSLRYGRRHPDMIDLQESLGIAQRRMELLVEEALVALEGQYQAAKQRYDVLTEELGRLEKESLAMDRLRIEYDVLRQKYETTKQTYDRIVQRLNETMITTKLVQSPVRVIDYAGVPSSPASPDQQKNMMAGGATAGAIACGVIGLLALLDRRLRSSDVIETQLKRPLLGEVPVLRRLTDAQRMVVVRDDLDRSIRELFQNICGQTLLSGKSRADRSLLITSCLPAEGKSVITTNLAFSFAAQGQRVALIDADLRAPTLDILIDNARRPGLVGWFQDRGKGPDPAAKPQDYLVNLGSNIDLLPAGGAMDKPQEVFSPEVFGELLAKLKETHDIVLVDAPPALIFHDALSVADMVDETIIVTRYLKVSASRLKGLFKNLDRARSRKIGVIFNGTPRLSSTSGAYYYGKAEEYYGKKRSKHPGSRGASVPTKNKEEAGSREDAVTPEPVS
ncbi:MAG: GumC family protein, partial [Opitutales bacterium]